MAEARPGAGSRRLGIHISTGKGLVKGAEHAREIGSNTMQIMSGNPSAWNPGKLDRIQARGFIDYVDEQDLRPVFLHAGYLINLSCRKGRNAPLYAKSIKLLAANVARARALECEYVVVHTGSRRGTSDAEALEALAAGLVKLGRSSDRRKKPVSGRRKKTPVILLENSAGSGDSTGATFEDLAAMLAAARKAKVGFPLGICLDTAHLWGAGYDLSSAAKVRKVVDEFDSIVGIGRLHCIHLNDSAVELGSRKDRHEHIGRGLMPLAGLKAFARNRKLRSVPMIMETPGRTEPSDDERMRDLFDLAGVKV
jgi:deoxyribonuclease-4